MLGIFLIYFIGKYFYELAEKADKSKGMMWLFAILGVISYYLGTIIGGFAIGVSIALFEIDVKYYPEIAFSFMALPFGILTCFGFYMILKTIWNKREKDTFIKDDDILDSNF